MSTLLLVILPLSGIILGWIIRWLFARFKLSSVEQIAKRISQDAVNEAEAKKKEMILETQDHLIKERNQQELELRERRKELQRYENRLLQREENLESKIRSLEDLERELSDRRGSLEEKEAFLVKEEKRWEAELEGLAGLTSEQAKAQLIKSMENEARREVQALLTRLEQEAIATAESKAREILVTTIQSIATEVTSDVTITSVSLPTDEMKGRIIGREGRNVRTLETLTGVDIIIDDTPEAVVISCFDPVRKEVAKLSLERLIADGRIHPARIEEIVAKTSKEILQIVKEEGERVLVELGIHNMHPELIKAVGRLHFRTSYGQNVLKHSKEVAIIAGALAAEIGANKELAKRSALLHDIGKGMEATGGASHVELGCDFVRKLGEPPQVLNGILSHHNDVEPDCVESVLVQVADAISAARPGARRVSPESYINRLENLEKIADSFPGVEKAFAMQAGRELRIIVDTKSVQDEDSKQLAKNIARKIESELHYPGRIKVTLIRETRVVEYAR